MMGLLSRALPLALAGCLFAAPPAFAFPTPIDDQTGLFGADALEEAADIAREARRDYGVELLFDLVRSVPADRARQVKSMNSRNRDRFFARWAEERAKEEGLDGILVLVCREPYAVKVYVTPSARDAFSERDGEHLRRVLVDHFERGPKDRTQFDKGLVEGARYVRDTLAARNPEGRQGAARFDWWWVAWVLGGILVVWMVAVGARAWLRRDQPPAPPVLPEPAPGLPGTVTAAATGDEICEAIFNPHARATDRPTAPHPDLAETADYGPPPPPPEA
ncbi:MAG TPA: hypothetical protein VFA26_25460 [Gemmataceae bacterium]|nr:hypothetical protein [Gemmataceae bacterium]